MIKTKFTFPIAEQEVYRRLSKFAASLYTNFDIKAASKSNVWVCWIGCQNSAIRRVNRFLNQNHQASAYSETLHKLDSRVTPP
jgi:hypothetical protein